MFKLKESLTKHFKNKLLIYFIVIVIFMVGISSGVITIKIMDESQRNVLHSFLNDFFTNLDSQKIDNIALFKTSIFNNFKTTFIIWIMGLIVVGLPITLLIIIFRGFIIGFSIGFMINDFGFKGFMLSLLTLIPQNLFIIPGLIVITVLSVTYSVEFIKNRNKNTKDHIFKKAIAFSIYILFSLIFILIGGFVEGYITPYLMKLIL